MYNAGDDRLPNIYACHFALPTSRQRKLDYDSGEGSHKPFVKGPGAAEDGSPFSTRLAHWKYMDSGELPKVLTLPVKYVNMHVVTSS